MTISQIPCPPDPSILDATVCWDRIVTVGDPVKHFKDRTTGRATALVVGFTGPSDGHNGRHVLVWPPSPMFGCRWAADRTEVAYDTESLPTHAEALAQYLRGLLLHELDTALAEAEADFAESDPAYGAGLRRGLLSARHKVEGMVGVETDAERGRAPLATT